MLDAVAEQLGLDVPDAEVEELVREQAEAVDDDADEMLVAAAREQAASSRSARTSSYARRLDHVAGEVKRIPLRAGRGTRGDLDARQGESPTETKLWTTDQISSTRRSDR